MPMVPFVIAAGALQYSAKKFLAAITLGRVVRYCILAYLGAKYGRRIFAVVLAHGEMTVAVMSGLVVVVVLWLVLMRMRRKRHAAASA
jgi:membrane protein DedA with SNARE-associated domain